MPFFEYRKNENKVIFCPFRIEHREHRRVRLARDRRLVLDEIRSLLLLYMWRVRQSFLCVRRISEFNKYVYRPSAPTPR